MAKHSITFEDKLILSLRDCITMAENCTLGWPAHGSLFTASQAELATGLVASLTRAVLCAVKRGAS